MDVFSIFDSYWFSSLLWAFISVLLTKGMILFVSVYITAHFLKKTYVRLLSRIWFLAILGFILFPLCWYAVPPLQSADFVPPVIGNASRLTAAPFLSRTAYTGIVEKTFDFNVFSKPRSLSGPAEALPVFLGIWIFGILFLLHRSAAAGITLLNMKKASKGSVIIQKMTNRISMNMDIRRRVGILVSSRCGIPFTCGFLRPVIFLPTCSSEWHSGRMERVLIHELAHVKRLDYLFNTTAYGICMLLWFIPVLWYAYSRMVMEEETCCDGQVIGNGVRKADYAMDILDIVRSSSGHFLLPKTLSAMGGKKQLVRRLKSVLDLKQSRFSKPVKVKTGMILAALATLVLLFSFTSNPQPYKPSPDEELYGMWEWEVDREYCRETAVFSEGKVLVYLENRSEPVFEERYTIDDKWIDGDGYVCYKRSGSWSFRPFDDPRSVPFYTIHRISPDGGVMETVCSQTGYPEEFSILGGGAYAVARARN